MCNPPRRCSSHPPSLPDTVLFGRALVRTVSIGSVLSAAVLINAVVLAGTVNPASANGISKWVDRDGGVHYGDQPPPGVDATPIKARPNVIDTETSQAPVFRPQRPTVLQHRARREEQVLPERAELRAYVEQCRRNRGVDCEWEARAMIDGPATVLFPGDPYIFARPDVKPPPPGLPLKFHIPPTP